MAHISNTKLILAMVAILSLMFVAGCGDNDDEAKIPVELDAAGTGYFTDKRDGKVYRAVKIGDLIWMAENLNYKVKDGVGSWCYVSPSDVVDTNCVKYGRYYNWATAMAVDTQYLTAYWRGSDVNHRGVCPEGWRMPNNRDWNNLIAAVGGRGDGQKLKSTTGSWYNSDTLPPLTDEFGFSALPGGHRNRTGWFYYERYYTYFWSATEYDRSYTYYEELNRSNVKLERSWDMQKICGLPVRCVTYIPD